jgi:hypothetical protein
VRGESGRMLKILSSEASRVFRVSTPCNSEKEFDSEDYICLHLQGRKVSQASKANLAFRLLMLDSYVTFSLK